MAQQGKYTDEEVSLIKNTFNDKEDLLLSLRNFMLQLPTQEMIEGVVKHVPELIPLFRKIFLAEATGEEPNGFVTNIWDQMDLSGKIPEQAYGEIMATDLIWRYLDQQLHVLAGDNVAQAIEWTDLRNVQNSPDDATLLINQLAYIGILRQVTAQINMLKVFSEKKEETLEELKKRLQRNSSK